MATREYASDDLRVQWDATRCIHVAACIRALPRVFNPLARPWVRIHAAERDEIIDAVERCPTGALKYVRSDGAREVPDAPATIEVVPDGPLLARGDLEIVTGDGVPIARETRVALCRCGASERKPFCDNTHRSIGFRSGDAPSAPPIERGRESPEGAESPADLGPAQPPSFPV